MLFKPGSCRDWSIFRRLLLQLCLSWIALAAPVAADPLLYSYGEACEKALSFYRQGWTEILDYGRWSEAERLYRNAVAVAPECLVAKSVLARITKDPGERKTLIREIQNGQQDVDSVGRLILDPYLQTLLLISARDVGDNPGESFRRELMEMAIENYGVFLHSYPAEWAVRIEYIEWIHARYGPAEALSKIREVTEQGVQDDHRWSYFPAYFYAELGDFAQATMLAQNFVQTLGPGDWPQKHYIYAYIAYESGDYGTAKKSIEQALLLDPRHLIAERLQKKINASMAAQ